MKHKYFKNYIAFTLMEMTLVLLITSVIAAATTPIITSRVSDAAQKGGPDSVELSASPWRTATTYNGGGIYNTPITEKVFMLGISTLITRGSFLAINTKPGADASVYQYPSLLINSYATGNIVRNPQIIIEPIDTVAPTSIIDARDGDSLKIGMDEYENILMASRSFTNANGATEIGYKNIFIGSSIQQNIPEDKLRASNSIFMGYNVNAYYASYAINIGSNINRLLNEQDVINIGSNLYGYSSSYSSIENINIGNSANSYGMGHYNVIMGNYAGYASNVMRNIIIGSYAGTKMSAQYYANYDNVIIGYYAFNRPSDNSNSFMNNVVLGKYAGARLSSSGFSDQFYNSINIGAYAGAYKNINGGVGTFFNSIAIGNYAGMYAFDSAKSDAIHRPNSIFIGNYAGYNSSNASGGKNIFIGNDAGKFSKSGESIYIGKYAGASTTSTTNNHSNIAIGNYAGYASQGYGNIYLGYNAGYSAKGSYNVGIGVNACRRLDAAATKKWCLGYETLMSAVSKTDNTTVWSPSNSAAQMVIGFIDVLPSNQNVVLYAYNVYRWGATNMDKVSDRRFKENIVPSKRSIKDIRKINIYEYNFKADKNKEKRIGVIAQEYKKVFPNDVVRNSATKKLALSVDWMIYTMVNAIKDVDNEIKHLQNDAKIYINDFSDLKAKISNLEKQAQQIKSENAEIKSHLAEINKRLK